MKPRIGMIVIAAVAMLFAACNKVSYKKTKGGMPYKLFSKGGQKVDTNYFIKLHFKQTLNDSVMVDTYSQLPTYFQVPPFSQPYDISELFFQLGKGDSLITIQMIDTFMKRNPQQMPPNFKKG
jgi:FKBP-type peptidyl-prolyl cis-trans isomerase FkpA